MVLADILLLLGVSMFVPLVGARLWVDWEFSLMGGGAGKRKREARRVGNG
jgi:hypothetical protein